MSDARPFRILARLRRMQLDQSRRALGLAAQEAEAAEATVRSLWNGVAGSYQDDPAADLQVRGAAIQGTRLLAVQMDRKVKQLQAVRRHLQDEATNDLLACRQVEIVLEAARNREREALRRRQQKRADERASFQKYTPNRPRAIV